MAAEAPGDVTQLLDDIRAGVSGARDRLVKLVYRRLHRMAVTYMAQEPDDHSLQPTALLDEAFLRILAKDVLQQAPNRAYLFGAFSRAMRHILAQHARRRRAEKRGRGQKSLPFDALVAHLEEEQRVDVVELRDALEALAAVKERASQVITWRMLGGFTVAEVAALLHISASTVEKDTRFALAWLHKQLGDDA